MMKAVLDVAYAGESLPVAARLPNLRYLGVGPLPSQIVKDVPPTVDLMALA
jgi:adenylosuccinate synthase